jgi:hypothetical protein
MSSPALNTLYEVIGKLTVQTQSQESELRALRAELSENATYITHLESRLREYIVEDPPAAAAKAKRTKLSKQADDGWEDISILSPLPLECAFGCEEGQRCMSHHPIIRPPERQLANICASCGVPLSTGEHIDCNKFIPLVRQIADNCASCGLAVSIGEHSDCHTFTPLVRQVANTLWHDDNYCREEQFSFLPENYWEGRMNDFENPLFQIPHDDIPEENIVIGGRKLTVADLAIHPKK